MTDTISFYIIFLLSFCLMTTIVLTPPIFPSLLFTNLTSPSPCLPFLFMMQLPQSSHMIYLTFVSAWSFTFTHAPSIHFLTSFLYHVDFLLSFTSVLHFLTFLYSFALYLHFLASCTCTSLTLLHSYSLSLPPLSCSYSHPH